MYIAGILSQVHHKVDSVHADLHKRNRDWSCSNGEQATRRWCFHQGDPHGGGRDQDGDDHLGGGGDHDDEDDHGSGGDHDESSFYVLLSGFECCDRSICIVKLFMLLIF